MRKKKFYLGKRHVKRYQWLRHENRKKVPRMLREYYGMLIHLLRIGAQEKFNINSSFGSMGQHMVINDGVITADRLKQSLERRKRAKQAILGFAPFHVIRELLDEAKGK